MKNNSGVSKTMLILNAHKQYGQSQINKSCIIRVCLAIGTSVHRIDGLAISRCGVEVEEPLCDRRWGMEVKMHDSGLRSHGPLSFSN